MQLPDSLRHEVRELERKMDEAAQAAEQAGENSRAAQEKADRLHETMGFRERHLGGRLWGDRQKARDYRKLTGNVVEFNEAAAGKRKEAQGFDRDITSKIHAYLAAHHDHFKTLLVPREAAQTLKEAVSRFGNRIRAALSAIDEAQQTDPYDLYTKGQGLASGPRNRQAAAYEALDDVERAAPAFRKAVLAYREKIRTIDKGGLPVETDDMTEPVIRLDTAYPESAGPGLRDALRQVRTVGDIAGRHFNQADQALSAYVTEARQACQP